MNISDQMVTRVQSTRNNSNNYDLKAITDDNENLGTIDRNKKAVYFDL